MNNERLKKVYAGNQVSLLKIKTWQQLYIYERIWEWSNQRIWKFKGLVIKVKKPNHSDWTFTIRWKTAGTTIEKIYPLSFPNFEKIELLDEYKVRRSKLYYIREKLWKQAKLKSKIKSEKRWFNLYSDLRKFELTERVSDNKDIMENNEYNDAVEENKEPANKSEE